MKLGNDQPVYGNCLEPFVFDVLFMYGLLKK